MIYTVTFNPSLDYIVRLDSFTAGAINRTKYEQVLGGGKGINVSIVLRNMGLDSTALGFTAGFTGQEIERQLHDETGSQTYQYIRTQSRRFMPGLAFIANHTAQYAGQCQPEQQLPFRNSSHILTPFTLFFILRGTGGKIK